MKRSRMLRAGGPEAARRRWRRAGLGLLGLVLLASLAVNAALWQAASGFYLDVQALRLQPLEEDRVRASNLQPATPGRRLWVFHGDSRAAAWPAPALEGHEFRNLGVGGQTSAQVLQRVSSQLLPLRPDVVVLQVGINDLKTIALFPDRRDSIVADLGSNIDRIVDAARGIGAQVVLTTIFPRSARLDLARRPFWSDDVDQAVTELNRRIASRAGPGVTVFDAATILSDDHGQVRAELARDLLHLLPPGYDLLNQALLRQLEAKQTR